MCRLAQNDLSSPARCVQVAAGSEKFSDSHTEHFSRERIEKYGGRAAVSSLEDLLTVTLERQPGKHLGIRISGSCPEPGIFIVEILEDSITALDGRIKVLVPLF